MFGDFLTLSISHITFNEIELSTAVAQKHLNKDIIEL
jgi:hypothetical protein